MTIRPIGRRAAFVAATLCLGVLVSGCTTKYLEEYNSVEQGNAKPAESPSALALKDGEIVDIGGPVESVVASGNTVAVQLASPSRLLLGEVRGTVWKQLKQIELPGTAGNVDVGFDGGFVVPYDDGVVQVSAQGVATQLSGLGQVTSAAVSRDGKLLTGSPEGVISVRGRDGVQERQIAGLAAVDQIVVAANGAVSALSRPDTTFGTVDLGSDNISSLLRAGKGAGRAASFSSESAVVSDAIGNALLVYSTNPVRLHQMFPIAGVPWAVAADPQRSVVWVTTTGTNRVQAYDLGDGIGKRVADLGTVRQPNSVAVTESGTVVVGSADGSGLQLATPTLDPL